MQILDGIFVVVLLLRKEIRETNILKLAVSQTSDSSQIHFSLVAI